MSRSLFISLGAFAVVGVILLGTALQREWGELGFQGIVGVFQVLSEPAIMLMGLLGLDLFTRWWRKRRPDVQMMGLSDRTIRWMYFVVAVLTVFALAGITAFGSRFVAIMTSNLRGSGS